MTVAENVGYGLDSAGVREPERSRRITDALALVRLDGFADRRPALLSGGQRQRVALARCLVTEPSLVLLDEPLANLDVHLRAGMEDQFAQFHARTRTTMIYITHDQAEAMALADRIAVMDQGRVLQFAAPSTLYREPADATVARFIGEGMVVPVAVRKKDGDAHCDVDLFGVPMRMRCAPGQREGPASAVLRSGDLVPATGDASGLDAVVTRTVYKGGHFRIEARLAAGVPEAQDLLLHLEVAEPSPLTAGQALRISVHDGWVLPA